ncbi:MAG: DUF1800 domain-containing protein [Parvularculaceae bacterium]|nr:DUF1800 domain-containing protein [Parvularculaceae bacterium]
MRVIALIAPALIIAACGGGTPPASPAPIGAPPAPLVADNPTAAEASRFLMQSTFGPTEQSISELVSLGYSAWMRRQLNANFESNVDEVRAIQADFASRGDNIGADALAEIVWHDMIAGNDQLRQRMAFALSQILVVSYENSDVAETPAAVAFYMDVLSRNAFGNYRTLLEDVTYSPTMAQFLTYLNNRKEDPSINRVPDENYARELMQLFTIGLVQLNDDGTPRLDSQGEQIETYTNDDITGLAKVFTGLSWDDGNFGGFHPRESAPTAAYSPLVIFPEHHSSSEKTFLGVTVPANTDAATSIDTALDTLFNHPNIAPFISKQLIQRFVTSNPSPQYVSNVTAAFETGWFQLPDGSTVGSSTRGDLAAVIAAVLLDPEARDLARRNDPDFGKVREPVIRFTHWARNASLNSIDVLGASGLNRNRNLIEANSSARLSQQAYRSPSVFNFYRPGYVAAGSLTANSNLVAPEMQITTTASVTGFANFIQSRVEESGSNDSFRPGYDAEMTLANDPNALVDRLSLNMTAGAMTAETRASIIAAVSEIPIRPDNASQDRRRRVNAAMLMTVLSPEFYVQR